MIPKNNSKKVVVGVSGGVDSTIALVLLKEKGYQPIAVSLKLPVWKNKYNCLRENLCCTDESLKQAKLICKQLDIEHHIYDVKNDFEKNVVDYFLCELKNCRTPNPCTVCNRTHKFKHLMDWAKENKVPYVATGHYAKIKLNKTTNKYELLKPKDKAKDQTYGLCLLPQKWLSKIIFPLQNLTKDQVYQIAQKYDFDFFFKKKQSQDFCYVSGKSLNHFITNKLGVTQGNIIDKDCTVLGKHNGLYNFTIGQRKGLGLNKLYYVKGFNKKKNELIVTENQKEITKKEINVIKCNFISIDYPTKELEVYVKIRYAQKQSKAKIIPINKSKIKVIFGKPQNFVTPGQFCVFYIGNACVGGGIIE